MEQNPIEAYNDDRYEDCTIQIGARATYTNITGRKMVRF